MKGKGNNICVVCQLKVKWHEDKIRLIKEIKMSGVPKYKKYCYPRMQNIQIWHLNCYDKIDLSKSGNKDL